MRAIRDYNYNNLRGCVIQRRNRITGTLISIYHTQQAGLDTSGGQWATVCEAHSTICNHESLKLARHQAGVPHWCEQCPQISEIEG